MHIYAGIGDDGQPDGRQWAFSPSDPDLPSYFGGEARIWGTGFSHFIPFEAPELVVQHIKELLSSGRARA